jgi:hypothetical protein
MFEVVVFLDRTVQLSDGRRQQPGWKAGEIILEQLHFISATEARLRPRQEDSDQGKDQTCIHFSFQLPASSFQLPA